MSQRETNKRDGFKGKHLMQLRINIRNARAKAIEVVLLAGMGKAHGNNAHLGCSNEPLYAHRAQWMYSDTLFWFLNVPLSRLKLVLP